MGRVDRDGRVGSPASSLFGDESQESLPEGLLETLGMAGASHLRPVEVNEGDFNSQASAWSVSGLLEARITLSELSFGRALVGDMHPPVSIQPASSPVAGPSLANSTVRAKKHVCQHCGKSFSQRWILVIHMRTHTGEGLFACTGDGCSKSFTQRSALIIHMRKHTGEGLFACTGDGCSKSFPQRSDLKIHMRTHTGERPFACTSGECSRSFSRRANLVIHMRRHTGEGLLACTWGGCSKAFAQGCDLKNHLLTHRPKTSCPVEECSGLFSAPNTINRHMRQKHPGWQPSS
jgi:insecticidal toxin complex protein TccC